MLEGFDFGAIFTAAGMAKLGQIVIGDLTMAGDNVVIMGSLASGLPARERKKVLLFGVGMALVFLITFAVIATQLLRVTGLAFAGGLLLLWVAYSMWQEMRPCKIIDPHPAEEYDRPVFKSVGCPDCFNKGTRGRTAMAELLYFNEEVKEWVEDRTLTARDVVQRAMRAGYLIPMKEVARQKVLAGITSEREVAAVLGLVESKRQYSNRESDRQPTDGHANSLTDAIERHEAVGKG